MSPEQAEGNKRVDHRTDLWAMAVIAFECITGRLAKLLPSGTGAAPAKCAGSPWT